VFLILAALYESWSLPFSVLLTIPVAIFGAFLGLWLRGYDLDVYAQIGLIVLIGSGGEECDFDCRVCQSGIGKWPAKANALPPALLNQVTPFPIPLWQNSTIKIAFFAAKTISTISPI